MLKRSGLGISPSGSWSQVTEINRGPLVWSGQQTRRRGRHHHRPGDALQSQQAR